MTLGLSMMIIVQKISLGPLVKNLLVVFSGIKILLARVFGIRSTPMKIISWASALIVGFGLMAGVPSGARADTTYTLVSAGTLPATTYGSVDVKTVTGNVNELEVVVTLSGTNHFANTGIDASFAFNLAGVGTITVSSLPATWSAENTVAGITTAGSVHMDGAGFFQYGLTFSNGGNTDGASLDFFITRTNIGLNTANVTGVAADLCTLGPNTNNNCSEGGLTGAVVGTTSNVPAPFVGAGLPGLIAACAGLLAFARRRRQKIA
jgi:hypothetical protein